ncbi:hypothetical protein MMC12_005312 [Toensbergia leucococca]|nr:hypothetical protein [Toensbergia leucococca]
MDLLWRNNIDPSKVNLGLGFYGRNSLLIFWAKLFPIGNQCNTAGVCGFSSGGNPGQCTASAGTLSFAEIERQVASGAKVTLDQSAAVKIVTWSNQWVSYDDEDTLKLKIEYANSKCLGGTMVGFAALRRIISKVWAASTDDLKGTAAADLSASTGRQELSLVGLQTGQDSIAQCIWGECGADCPAGTTPAQRSDGHDRGNVGLWNGCALRGLSSKQRNYCCPTNSNDKDYSHFARSRKLTEDQTFPLVSGEVLRHFVMASVRMGRYRLQQTHLGQGQVARLGTKRYASDTAIAQCTWVGSAPSCAKKGQAANCPSGLSRITQDSFGSGGDAACYTGAKSFCCPNPSPYQNCDWFAHGDQIIGAVPYVCGTPQDCPAGKYAVASDPSGCGFGTAKYFCCDSPGGYPELDSFQNLLNLFKTDPTCSHGERVNTKRATYLTTDQMMQFDTIMAQILQSNGQSALSVLQRNAFDATLGPTLGTNSTAFQNLYGLLPGLDPLYVFEQFACLGARAGEAIAGMGRTRTELCVAPTMVYPGAPTPTNRVPSMPPNDELRKRNVDNDPTELVFTGGDPAVYPMLEALINDEFTYMYTRMFQFDGGPGGEVEVAFLLGINPGNINPQYQGTQTNPPDMYLVLHFHVSHILNDDQPGLSWPAVWNFNMFIMYISNKISDSKIQNQHGQFAHRPTEPYQPNTVDGRSTSANGSRRPRNARAILFDCPEDDVNYWYAGWVYDDSQDQPIDQLVNRVGVYLNQRNYFNTAIMREVSGGSEILSVYTKRSNELPKLTSNQISFLAKQVVFPNQPGEIQYLDFSRVQAGGTNPFTYDGTDFHNYILPTNYP